MTEQKQVRVGVGVFILSSPSPSTSSENSNPTILLGKRLSSHGSGTYALPGGHLEYGETPEVCAAREVLEETGLHVTDVTFLTATNDFMESEGRHYVTLFVSCRRVDETQKARVEEPGKCEGWEWWGWGEVVRLARREVAGEEMGGMRLFMPLVDLVRQRPGVVPGL